MRLPLTLITIAINIIIFVTMGTFLMVDTKKTIRSSQHF